MATWYTQFLFTVKPERSQDGRDGVPGVMGPAHGEKPLSVIFGVNILFFFNHLVAFSAHSWRENDFQEAECIWCLWGSHVSKHCTPGLFRRQLYSLRKVLKLLCPGWRRVNTVSFECHHGLCWICYFSHKMTKRGPRTGWGWVEWGCLRALSHSGANSHGVCNHSNHGLKKFSGCRYAIVSTFWFPCFPLYSFIQELPSPSPLNSDWCSGWFYTDDFNFWLILHFLSPHLQFLDLQLIHCDPD